MSVCCCSLAGTAACQHCPENPFATDVWTNKTVTVDHIEAKPFGNGLDVCPVCGKPSTIGKPQTNADRIRSMNNKELARVLEGTSYPWCNTPINCHHNNCYDCCEEWLKKEVKE